MARSPQRPPRACFPRTHGAFRVAGIPFAVHQALGCQKVLFEGRYGQTGHRAGCEMQGGQVDEIAVQFATGRSPQMSAEDQGAGVKTGEASARLLTMQGDRPTGRAGWDDRP